MTNDDTDRRRRLLGWGVASAEIAPGAALARDVVLVAGPGGLDFARVEGLDALAQDLTVAMTTARGSDPFNTTFGFDGLNALTDDTPPGLVGERLRLAVMALLQRDARVRRILDVTVGRSRGRTLDVTVRFEALGGDQVEIGLGTVGIDG